MSMIKTQGNTSQTHVSPLMTMQNVSNEPTGLATNTQTVNLTNLNSLSLLKFRSTNSLRCGTENGETYKVFGLVDFESICQNYNINISDISQFNIVFVGDTNATYNINTNNGETFFERCYSSGNEYVVPMKDIIQSGYHNFTLELDDYYNCVNFSNVRFELETYNSGSISFNPDNYVILIEQYETDDDYTFGTENDTQYFVGGKFDYTALKNELGNALNISSGLITDVKIKFSGTPNKNYDVWTNNGFCQIVNNANSGNVGEYIVPITEIVNTDNKNYDEFSITHFENSGTINNYNYSVEVTYVKNVTDLPYGDHANQVLDITFPTSAKPTGGFPVVFTVHGGEWSVGSDKSYYDYMTTPITSKGCVHVNIEYRLMNGGGADTNLQNGETPCDRMLADIHSAIDKVVDLYRPFVNTCKFALMGYSAGGHLALLYAYKGYNDAQNGWTLDDRIKLVISEAGPIKLDATEDSLYNYIFTNNNQSKGYELIDNFRSLINDVNLSNLNEYSPYEYKCDNTNVYTLLIYGSGYYFDPDCDDSTLPTEIYNPNHDGDDIICIYPARNLRDERQRTTLCEIYGHKHNDFYGLSNLAHQTAIDDALTNLKTTY